MWSKLLVVTLVAAGCLSVGCGRSDPDIAAEATVRVTTDAQLRDLTLAITSQNGVVRLAGDTPSTEDQERAVGLVRAVSGVRDVVNDMWVRDAVLIDAVRRRLAEDSLTSAVAIDVQAERGTVRLYSGETTKEVRQRAVELARQVDGARRVEDWMK